MASTKKLYRAGKDHVLGGVCAGLAEYLSIDVIFIRVIWLILTLVHGFGAVAYVVCLVLIPKNPAHEQLPISEQKKAENYGLYIGLALVIIGLNVVFHRWFDFFFWDLDWLFFTFHWKIVWPILFVLLGVWFIVRSSKEEKNSGTSKHVFYRSPDTRMISGVCGGLAELWQVDVTLVRVGYAVATLLTGFWFGLLAYVVMAIVIKERDVIPQADVVVDEPKTPPKRPRASRAQKAAEPETPVEKPASENESGTTKSEGESDEQK